MLAQKKADQGPRSGTKAWLTKNGLHHAVLADIRLRPLSGGEAIIDTKAMSKHTTAIYIDGPRGNRTSD